MKNNRDYLTFQKKELEMNEYALLMVMCFTVFISVVFIYFAWLFPAGGVVGIVLKMFGNFNGPEILILMYPMFFLMLFMWAGLFITVAGPCVFFFVFLNRRMKLKKKINLYK